MLLPKPFHMQGSFKNLEALDHVVLTVFSSCLWEAQCHVLDRKGRVLDRKTLKTHAETLCA